MNIIQAIKSKEVFRPYFNDLSTWNNWLIFLKALFGLKLSKEEMKVFRKCTKLRKQPEERLREAWICSGRRSGKSRTISILACFLALFMDWSKHISRGERPYIFIISPNKDQGQIILNYIRELLNLNDSLRSMIQRELSESIELTNGITISIKSASWRSTRGFSALAVILEEVCYFRWETDSALRDKEIYRSLKPALSTIPVSLMIGISTPHSFQGLMAEKMKKHWGKSKGNVLCWKSSTLDMNPTIDKEEIKAAYKDDPEFARSEWGAEWRRDISSLLDIEAIEEAVDKKIFERPYEENQTYKGFIDPSGGKSDSFCCALSHQDKETKKIVLDVLREARPPFRPESIVKEYSELLKKYGVTSIKSDSYAGEWVVSAFSNHSITVEKASMNKSDYYLNALPLFNNSSVRILDQERLKNQLMSLERKTRSGSSDRVDNFHGHDDAANVCCAVLVESQKKEKKAGAGVSDVGINDIWGDDDTPSFGSAEHFKSVVDSFGPGRREEE